MRYTIYFLAIFSLLLNTKKEKIVENPSNNNLKELFQLMQGSFDSEKQSLADSTYYNISLHMYPIWQDKGHFLYVEQALNNGVSKPYRQRIYEVTQIDDETFSSAVYTIPNDSLWIGKWKTPEAFNTLSLNDIEKKSGCEVILKRIKPKSFKGSTGHKTCSSSLYGASYATSEVEVLKDKIISWDRGFDSNGKHIWGAEKGGYIFERKN
ncbi:chromophore lyase CpcT/CpeT [Hanstruepera flava]|uniref:chromophore lyase CpcT/CpeT n=1 Tax=Hanstruepera flava TaxID=2930218 RepID=UPI0020296E91|nr:chromophore lyase CpcT/CpeT [Hanstruepera flava]